MTTPPERRAGGPWFRATLAALLAVVAASAAAVWNARAVGWVVPVVVLPVALLTGLALTVPRDSRSAGLRVVGATLLAAVVAAALVVVLVLAYSATHPEWELS